MPTPYLIFFHFLVPNLTLALTLTLEIVLYALLWLFKSLNNKYYTWMERFSNLHHISPTTFIIMNFHQIHTIFFCFSIFFSIWLIQWLPYRKLYIAHKYRWSERRGDRETGSCITTKGTWQTIRLCIKPLASDEEKR